MTQELVLTQGWSLDQLLPYGPQITACIRRLVDRFPEDATVQSMAADLFSGAVQLWIMLDDGNFKGAVFTTVKEVEATGYKSVIVSGLAGEDGVELAPHIAAIEAWARDAGAKSVTPVGRLGWKKPLAALGYGVDRVIYRKDLT